MKTFSGYELDALYNQVEKSIWLSKFEESCHWAAEIHLSNLLDDWWDNKMIIWMS